MDEFIVFGRNHTEVYKFGMEQFSNV
jgi:hypothetical protein